MKTPYSFYITHIKHFNKCQLFFRLMIIFSIFIVEFKPAFAQDTTKITYGLELDTLVKQRFIDRYENVFMTKVPTRHMFKIGISQYFQPLPFSLIATKILYNSSLTFGYEFKFLPAFSISLSSHVPFYVVELPSTGMWKNTVGDAQLRWYLNMRKRIKYGKSANNFSGNYLALNYTTVGTAYMGKNSPTAGLKLGFQRRFFNSGFMDFNLAFQQTDLSFRYGVASQWSITSQASFGLAFGDWKKARKQPWCDVLLCDANLTNQLKIKLPEITVGYNLNRARLGLAYERKLGSSSFTINLQYDISLNKGLSYSTEKSYLYNLFNSYGTDQAKEIAQYFTIQPRYYFLQRRQQLKGTGGNGMSGFYTGINTEYYLYSGKHHVENIIGKQNIKQNTLYAGLLAGFQQRLFRHGYLDFNTSYNFKREFISSHSSLGLRGNLGLGFAF